MAVKLLLNILLTKGLTTVEDQEVDNNSFSIWEGLSFSDSSAGFCLCSEAVNYLMTISYFKRDVKG